MRAPVERGSVSLRVAADEVDAVADAKLADQLLAADDRVPVTSSRASGSSASVPSAVSRR